MVYVERIISLHIDMRALERIENEKQLGELYKALGRQLLWGLSGKADGDTDFVSSSLDRDGEIVAAFHRAIPRHDYNQLYSGSLQAKIADLHENLKWIFHGTAFVIGAIPSKDGLEYSYHS